MDGETLTRFQPDGEKTNNFINKHNKKKIVKIDGYRALYYSNHVFNRSFPTRIGVGIINIGKLFAILTCLGRFVKKK